MKAVQHSTGKCCSMSVPYFALPESFFYSSTLHWRSRTNAFRTKNCTVRYWGGELAIYCLDIDEESLLIYCLDIEEESLPRGRNKSGAVTELCGCPHPLTVIIIVVLLQVVALIIAVVTIFILTKVNISVIMTVIINVVLLKLIILFIIVVIIVNAILTIRGRDSIYIF